MAYDDEEDLFEDDYDLVDEESDLEEDDSSVEDEEDDSELEVKKPPRKKRPAKGKARPKGSGKSAASNAEKAESPEAQPEADAEPPGPPADHLVHIYAHGQFKRTISREFTEEDAVNFAETYNVTSKPYGRKATALGKDEKPDPTLD